MSAYILVLMFISYFDADTTALREVGLRKLNENISTTVTQLLFQSYCGVRILGHELRIRN